MNRKAFRQLLRRYLDNSCTEEEKRIVDQWYELLDNGNRALSNNEINEIEDRLWNKIQSTNINTAYKEPLKIKRIVWWKYVAAASLTGIFVLISVVWFQNKKKQTSTELLVVAKVNQGFLEEANNSDTAKNIKLEDGSSVTIYPGSKLAFPKHFAVNKREVYLAGDAFFTVSKNPNRPFFVYNNQIVTQVLGTSFGIHKRNGQVEVAVKTGRVAVYENKDQISLNEVQQKSNGVIITPNQKVTYYQEERHFVTSIVDQPLPILKESNTKIAEVGFNYNETPLYKVLNDLENMYGLEIVLENEKLKNCLFTGDLSEQNLFNKLEGICLVFNASYEIKGTKILLKGGKDCI
jgi:ferric-dicitrate binding protein FerR (iron transport regulator)